MSSAKYEQQFNDSILIFFFFQYLIYCYFLLRKNAVTITTFWAPILGVILGRAQSDLGT